MSGLGKHVVAILALVSLLGCGSEPKPAADLSLACALEDCTCKGRDGSFFRKASEQPPLWNESGHAYCPENFDLARVKKKKNTYYSGD